MAQVEALDDIAEAFGIGRPIPGRFTSAGPSTFSLETDQGRFAVRFEGWLDGSWLSGRSGRSRNDVEVTLKSELDLVAHGAQIAAPVTTKTGAVTFELTGATLPVEVGGRGPQLVSVHRWVQGRHPKIGSDAIALQVGHALGAAVASVHQVNCDREEPVLGAMQYVHFPDQKLLLTSAEGRGARFAGRIKQLMPAMERCQELFYSSDIPSIGTYVHGDIHIENGVLTNANQTAYLIDFDPGLSKWSSALVEIAELANGYLEDAWPVPQRQAMFATAAVRGYLEKLDVPDLNRADFAMLSLVPTFGGLLGDVVSRTDNQLDAALLRLEHGQTLVAELGQAARPGPYKRPALGFGLG